jgi:hypothetical protein
LKNKRRSFDSFACGGLAQDDRSVVISQSAMI